MSQSPLDPYQEDIEYWTEEGCSNREIVDALWEHFEVNTTKDSVRRAKRRFGLDEVSPQPEPTKPLESRTDAFPRILYVDIETSPNIADVWGLWDQNVGLSQLRQSCRIIGFGAKWQGQKKVQWFSEYDKETGELSAEAHREMLEAAHDLYDEADIVVTYNGDKFDHKHFNSEWVSAGLPPPAPVKSLDLCKVVKKHFKFPSNKLQYVSQRLLGDTKLDHTGHQMWRDCLDPDVDPKVRQKAWAMMERYCKKDVALMEPLHEILLPWLPTTINVALMAGPSDTISCQKCGSDDLESRGTAYTATRAYPQYRCRSCGGWTRDSRMSWKAPSGVV